MSAPHSTTPLSSLHPVPVSEPTIEQQFPSMLLFWCDGCEEFMQLPAWSADCPDCRTELQDCSCEFSCRALGLGECGERATHTTTFLDYGEAPGRGPQEIEQPRCARH